MCCTYLALAAGGRRDNVLFVRQGVLDEANNETVRQVPSRPQLKRGPLDGTKWSLYRVTSHNVSTYRT